VTGDEITLTLPRERGFYGVADLVLGGLAARLDVTLEDLEDLELAVAGLLERMHGDEPVTLRLAIDEHAIRAAVGPEPGEPIRSELANDAGQGIGLRRLLDAVVDQVDVVQDNGVEWVEVTKTVRRA
jgi:anti-sigma regulatory factor (Ser/Thr protein kinase)